MIINWDGKAYSLDFADIDLHQAEVIEKETGQTIDKWLDALGEGTQRLQFVKLLYWLMLSQNGEDVPVGAVNFKLVPFSRAFAEAMAAEEPAPPQEAVDPTQTGQPGPTSPSPPAPPTPPTSEPGEVPSPAIAS